MSLKKPIIKVTKRCPNCVGYGSYKSARYSGYDTCDKCIGTGIRDVKQNDPQFKKYYIKNLEEVIEYWTRLYRNKNKEAQDYLKKVREYSKELDKVVNK